ncbi:MAG TPA: hypothetical protein VHZ26_02975 [Caulobacteraceae bacterium]|jgi:hypothetical protein|nr:hypothetical protein [Caulobacteraceae bacterium]
MSVLGVLDHRFRGFRIIEIGGVGVLLALILLVYLAKTIAGGQSAQIDRVQQQIADEKARVTLLRAEVASLEQPERLETLSGRFLNLQPVDAKHEIDAQALSAIAHADAPPASSQPPGGAPPPPPPDAATVQAATPPAATPAPPAAAVVPAKSAAAKPGAAKPVKLATAAPPDAARPTKSAKAAVAHAAAARPTRLAAVTHADAAAPVPAEAGDTRPSELKPPAVDPIGSLVAPPAGSGDQ